MNITNEKKPLIILTGPTAVGKTALSIGLAKAVGGEIISADSMQVYKHMDIGTAKIMPEEMQGVPHFMIDELEPWEEFNVMYFQQNCKKYMKEIWERGHVPILTGGTGFYIQSVLYDIDFTETETDYDFRNEMEQFAKEHGAHALHEQLASVDLESANEIHENNVKRVIRALEYFHQTGEKISEHNKREREKQSPYRFRYFVLSLPREILYDRINRRVDLMRQNGLTEEVKKLQEMGCTKDMVSMQGLGYKEILEAFEGKCTLDEAYDKIKQETRHFAKRQCTWFRREKHVTMIDKGQFSSEQALLDHCLALWNET